MAENGELMIFLKLLKFERDLKGYIGRVGELIFHCEFIFVGKIGDKNSRNWLFQVKFIYIMII